jgi:hypothetical protein
VLPPRDTSNIAEVLVPSADDTSLPPSFEPPRDRSPAKSVFRKPQASSVRRAMM